MHDFVEKLFAPFRNINFDDDYSLCECPQFFDFDMSATDDVRADNDAHSISSFSTNSTADDIPGPGRVIDKYVYRPCGKTVEQHLFRMRAPSLPPAHIARRIQSFFSLDLYRAGLRRSVAKPFEAILLGIQGLNLGHMEHLEYARLEKRRFQGVTQREAQSDSKSVDACVYGLQALVKQTQ